MMKRTQLSRAIHAAMACSLAMAMSVAGAAHAQASDSESDSVANKSVKDLSAVVVTGSHIRRVDIEISNPVISIGSQQIAETGSATVGEVLSKLPALIGVGTNPHVNNGGGTGATRVGVHSLGPQRTLMLVDGQRVISDDLNSIPLIAVDHIDVLTDGASAVYGSDAIGGVVNIVLKQNFQGAQLQTDYGISGHNDAARKSANLIFGGQFDKGSLFAGIGYNQYDKLYQSSRKFSDGSLSLVGGPNGTVKVQPGGQTNAPRNDIIVPSSIAKQFGCNQLSLNTDAYTSGKSPTTLADYHCFNDAEDLYDSTGSQLLVTPQQRINTFLKGVFHITDSIDAYGTMYENKTNAGFELAPPVANQNQGVVLSQYSMYNPFGVDFSRASGNTFQSRETAAGNRIYNRSVDVQQGLFGIRGQATLFGKDWTWDVGYNYGHSSLTVKSAQIPSVSQLNTYLGPSMLVNGVPTCVKVPNDPTTAIAGCTPYDPFNQNAATTLAVIPAARSQGQTTTWAIERTSHVDVSGGLFDLPGGTSQLAVGLQWRDEYTNNFVDANLLVNPATNTCQLGEACASHLQGGYSVREAYTELFLPVLAGLPLIKTLNVTLGDRYSHYSTFGSTNNWKVGIEYRPISDLLLRGTVTTLFRAPTIGDVFASPSVGALALSSDPCDGIKAPNAACVGVPTDGSFRDNQIGRTSINTVGAGSKYFNFPLGPEQGKSFDFGAVYSPSFAPGLSASADVWRIYLNNVITNISGQTIIDLCFSGISKYCPLIQRYAAGTAAAGQIQTINRPTVNLGRIDVQGIDASLNYRFPAFSLGQFTAGVDATYMSTFTIQTAPGQKGNVSLSGVGLMGTAGSPLQSACPIAAGQICFIPRIRGEGRLNWERGPWSATWRMRYISGFDVGSTDPTQSYSAARGLSGANAYVMHFGATVYNDITLGYLIRPLKTQLTFGIDNLFDRQPPILYSNNSPQGNTDGVDFDTVGRYYWLRATVTF